MSHTLIASSILLTVVSASLAQPPIPQPGTREYREWQMRRQQMKPEAWSVSGKIHSFNTRAGEVNVVAEDGRPWRVKLGKDAPVNVKGEAGAAFLKPHSAVRFYAPITKKGIVTEPVEKLTAFTPRPPFAPMLEPTTEEEARAAMEEEEAENAEAQSQPPEEESGLTLQDRIAEAAENDNRRQSQRERDDDDKESAEAEWYQVTGILVSLKKGKFVIDAGEAGKLRGELAEDAKVEADLLGIQFASPGDTIEANGQTFPAQPMTAMAASVNVTLTPQPAAEEQRPRRAARTRSRRSETAEEQQPFSTLPQQP